MGRDAENSPSIEIIARNGPGGGAFCDFLPRESLGVRLFCACVSEVVLIASFWSFSNFKIYRRLGKK